MKNNIISGLFGTLLLVSFNTCNQSGKAYKERNENSITSEKIVYIADKGESDNLKHKVYGWRGENRSGIYNQTGLLKAWPEDGPALIWEYEGIGNGYGSPIFTEDKMYILGEIDSLAYLFAFDFEGNLIWKKEFGNEWTKGYGGSRSTPTIVDDLIYVTTGFGNLCCFNRYSGEKKWEVEMVGDLHGRYPLFGYSESVIVEEDKVFCTPGGKDTNVVALNRFTGELIWVSQGKGERHAYNSPQIIRLKDRNVLVNFTANELMGHDTKTGELLWVHELRNSKQVNSNPGNDEAHSNTIIYEDGFIYYATTGEGNGGVKLEIGKDGESIRKIWYNKDFDGYMGGIVKLGNYLYGCGEHKRGLKCINAKTGKTEKVLGIGKGAVIAADGMLYYYNYAGEVILITEYPDNMKILGEFKIIKGQKEHFSHPVINSGKLYIRHGNFIQAYNIKNSTGEFE